MSLRTTLPIALVALTALAAPGCRSAAPKHTVASKGFWKNPLDWGAETGEPREGLPERVVATWADTVRQTPGQPSERGFGGRIYFYDRGEDPIAVKGRLVVYAFDETGREATDHRPTRRFVFPVEQLASHMSVSEIGPSYSVWLPWGTVDGPPTEISLTARFEPLEGGGLVASDMARQRLPGQGVAPAPETMLAEKPKPAGVRQAGFEESAATAATTAEEPRQRLSTTTIRLQR